MSVENQESSASKAKRLVQTFSKIYQFIQDSSSQFYSKNSYFEKVEGIRSLQEKAPEDLRALIEENPKLEDDLQEILMIDERDGVRETLNAITLSVGYLSNPKLFDTTIKKKLDIQDLTKVSFHKIPREVDVILFMNNPLIIFDLVNEFMVYRDKADPAAHQYITHRISQYLYRFTQFIMEYHPFTQMVQYTFLTPGVFNPYQGEFLKALRQLCFDAKKEVLRVKTPVFINDMRRFYLILTRALFYISLKRQAPPHGLTQALADLREVVNLDHRKLKEDGIYEEFLGYSLFNPQHADAVIKCFQMLYSRSVNSIIYFLVSLHPADAQNLLSTLYRKSRRQSIRLFLDLKKVYVQNSREDLQMIFKLMDEVVSYDEVCYDSSVGITMVNLAFDERKLDYQPVKYGVYEARVNSSEAGSIEYSESSKWSIRSEVFSILSDPKEKKLHRRNFSELLRIPFCFVTVEYGKEHFHLFNVGESLLLNINEYDLNEVVQYLSDSKQLRRGDARMLIQEMPELKRTLKSVVSLGKSSQKKLPLYDQQGVLQFYDFKRELESLRESLEVVWGDLYFRVNSQQFTLLVLQEITQHMASKHHVSPSGLPKEDLLKFVYGDSFKLFLGGLTKSLIGRLYTQLLNQAIINLSSFREHLVDSFGGYESILAHERVRFEPRRISEYVKKKKKNEEKKPQSRWITLADVTRERALSGAKKEGEANKKFLVDIARIPFRAKDLKDRDNPVFVFTIAELYACQVPELQMEAVLKFLMESFQINREERQLIFSLLPQIKVAVEEAFEERHWKPTYIMDLGVSSLNFSSLNLHAKQLSVDSNFPFKHLMMLKRRDSVCVKALSEVRMWTAQQLQVTLDRVNYEALRETLRNRNKYKLALDSMKHSRVGKRYYSHITADKKSIELFNKKLLQECNIQQSLDLYFHHQKKA